MQEAHVGVGNHYGYDSETLICAVNNRILYVLKNGEIIVYIKNKKTLRSGEIISDFAKNLMAESPHIYYKDKASLFTNPEITHFLKYMNVSEIETIGVDGNCCVACSALDATKNGYSVVFPCKYIGVKNMEIFCKKKELLRSTGVEVID